MDTERILFGNNSVIVVLSRHRRNVRRSSQRAGASCEHKPQIYRNSIEVRSDALVEAAKRPKPHMRRADQHRPHIPQVHRFFDVLHHDDRNGPPQVER